MLVVLFLLIAVPTEEQRCPAQSPFSAQAMYGMLKPRILSSLVAERWWGEEGGVGQMVGRLASQAQGLGGPAKDEEDSIMACREWNLCRCSKGKLLWVVCLNN